MPEIVARRYLVERVVPEEGTVPIGLFGDKETADWFRDAYTERHGIEDGTVIVVERDNSPNVSIRDNIVTGTTGSFALYP